MKTFQLVAMAAFFLSSFAVGRANLGETEAQCVVRYGPELSVQTDVGYRQVGDKAATFILKTSRGSYDIKVTFLRGLSCHESFTNDDSAHGLSMVQMKGVLDNQSAGLKWSKEKTMYRTGANTTYGIVDWLRSDGATARFWMSGEADTQVQSGQVDLSTKLYASAQRYYDQQNGN